MPICSIVWVSSFVSLLSFCLTDLSIEISGVLRSPTIIYWSLFLLLNRLILIYVARCPGIWCGYIYYGELFWGNESLDHYVASFLTLLLLFMLKSILSDIKMAIPAHFSFPLHWNILFHSFTFSFHTSLLMTDVSCSNS